MVIFMFYYLNMFLIGSIVGFIIETSLKTFIFPSINNGILYGPWVPVYGFGVVIIILIERLIFNRTKISKPWKIFIMFLLIMLVVTVVELIGGYLIELFFHKTFWEYSNLKFNIGKYIALEISLIWGILSLAFIYFVKPLIEKFIYKIPRWLSILVFGNLILDLIFTMLKV